MIDTYNSPQGDGNFRFVPEGRINPNTDRYLQFPARGRKHLCSPSLPELFWMIDTYNSPQGDGN